MFEKEIRNYLNTRNYEQINLHTAMFDMDGVLFDSMKNHARSWHETMKHFGMNLPYEEAFLHEGRTGTATINIVSMRERGYGVSDEEAKEIYEYKSKLFSSCPEAPAMKGALELLQKVKADGITPMVITGSGQRSLLDRLQAAYPNIFEPQLMVTAFDVKYGKPNPEPYLMGLKKGGTYEHASHPLDCNQSVVIENAPLGVKAGVAAGVFTIAVNTGPLPDSALLDAGANLLFPSMQALADAWETFFMELKQVRKR